MRGDVIPRRVSLRALDRRQILASAPVRCLSPKSGLTQAAQGRNQAQSWWLRLQSGMFMLAHGEISAAQPWLKLLTHSSRYTLV